MNCQDCGSKMETERTLRAAKVTIRIERCPCGSRFESEQRIARRLTATGSTPGAHRAHTGVTPNGTGSDSAGTGSEKSLSGGGQGVGLPPDLSGSGQDLSSGPSLLPDPGVDRPLAREPDPDPNDIRLDNGEVTEYGIAKVFGRVRGRDWPKAFPWQIPKSSPDKAAGIVTDANADPAVRADLIPSMVLLFVKAKAGEISGDIKDPTVAFGWWVSKFTALREELHGRSRSKPVPRDDRCEFHRRPRTNEKRAPKPSATCSECKHVNLREWTREDDPDNLEPAFGSSGGAK